MGSTVDPPGGMEDAHAQFLIAVGDLCIAAEVGGLIVELLTGRGESTAGVPAWIERPRRDRGGEAGYGRTFRVSGRVVNIDDVVACTIRAPHLEPPAPRVQPGAVNAPRDPAHPG